MSSTVVEPGLKLATRVVPDSGFYLAFAIASAVVVFAGFSRSYYLKAYFNTPRLPLLFHVHGAVFTVWVLYFIVQTWLVSDGRFNLHRQMGMAGAVLASAMVVLGVAIAFVSGSMGHFSKIPGATDPAQACLFSLFDITLFGAFVWAGFLWRYNPEVHSRLMSLSMAVPLLPSAIARLCNFKPGFAAPMIFAFMLAGPIYDLVTRRKIHFGAFVWAGFLWRYNPEVHSRLMLLSMAVPLLPSAIARLCNFKPGFAAPMIFAFMLAGPIYDLVTRRKIHPAYLVGVAIIILTGPPVRLLLGRTALWHRLFANVIALGS
jgi:hypothetical protein